MNENNTNEVHSSSEPLMQQPQDGVQQFLEVQAADGRPSEGVAAETQPVGSAAEQEAVAGSSEDRNAANPQSEPARNGAMQGATVEYAPPVGVPVSNAPEHPYAYTAPYAQQPQVSSPYANTPYGAQTQQSASSAAPSAVTPSGSNGQANAVSKGGSSGKTFLVAFAGALVACVLAIGVGLGFGLFGSGSNVTLGSTSTSSVGASDVEATLAEAVADKCLPSVVSIDVYGQQQSNQGYFFGFGLGSNGNESSELTQLGLGSGVILSEDGYIITNNHVVENGSQFKVTIQGNQYDADFVGADASSDVAVLKVKDASGFTPITLGDSDNIKIGEWVMSIGSPFGLEQSVATGIVSATSRSQIMEAETDMFGNSTGEATIYPNMIQTDAAINPGNSGGALVNSEGALIGINTMITSYSGNYSGVGFAIPSNYAINLAQSIIAGEEPTRAFLGISMTTINSSIAQRYGFATDEGAYVSSVEPGSAAADAGLKVGDIIVSFDGEKVSSASDVMLDVRLKNPGDKVKVGVMRDGQQQEVEVTLGKSQAETSSKPGKSEDRGQNNSGNSGKGGSLFGF